MPAERHGADGHRREERHADEQRRDSSAPQRNDDQAHDDVERRKANDRIDRVETHDRRLASIEMSKGRQRVDRGAVRQPGEHIIGKPDADSIVFIIDADAQVRSNLNNLCRSL